MTTRTIDIKTADGICDTYVSYPDAGGPFPAVLFYMDAIGVRPVLNQMADRMAAAGFYVILPNVFYRSGRAPVMEPTTVFSPENLPKLMALIGGMPPDKVVNDAGTYLDFLSQQKEVKPGSKVVTTGYCFGGTMSVRTAAAFPERVAAAAAYHAGGLVTDDPKSPHKLLGSVKAELYFGHADNDPYASPEQVKTLEAALATAGVKSKSELYPGAAHGFTMIDLPMHNAAAEKKHWDTLLSLFKRNT